MAREAGPVAEVRASEAIHGVVLVDPVVHGDQRGLFGQINYIRIGQSADITR